jgi:hypothetical protein
VTEIPAHHAYHINVKVCYNTNIEPNPLSKRLLITTTTRSTPSFSFIAFEEVQGPKKMVRVLLVRLQVNVIVDQHPNKLNNIRVSAKVLHKSLPKNLMAPGELVGGNASTHELKLSSCRRVRHVRAVAGGSSVVKRMVDALPCSRVVFFDKSDTWI